MVMGQERMTGGYHRGIQWAESGGAIRTNLRYGKDMYENADDVRVICTIDGDG